MFLLDTEGQQLELIIFGEPCALVFSYMLFTYFSEPEPESQIPERPSRREPLVVKEHENIVLTATLAAPSVAAVTWLKDGVEIRRSKRHEVTSQGDTHTLTVRGAQVLDSAIYSCRVGKEGQDFPVQVEGKKSGSPPGSLHLPQRRVGSIPEHPQSGAQDTWPSTRITG